MTRRLPAAQRKKILQGILRVQELIQAGWTRGDFARRGRKATMVTDPKADHFCLLGACQRACIDIDGELFRTSLYDKLRRLLTQCIPDSFESVMHYNDAPGRSKVQILKVVDCAVKAAQEQV